MMCARRAVGWGRDPDSIKVLFLAAPVVDLTMEAAQDRRRLLREDAAAHLDLALCSLSRLTNIDFAKLDPDEPLPPTLTTNGHQSSLKKWIGKTPRELALSQSTKMGIDFNRHGRSRGGDDAGDHGGGGRRRLSDLQHVF